MTPQTANLHLILSVFPPIPSSEAFSGPTNIQFTGQTSDSLRFRWSQAGGPVSGYVVQYVPLSGLGQPITAELRQVSPGVGDYFWWVACYITLPLKKYNLLRYRFT